MVAKTLGSLRHWVKRIEAQPFGELLEETEGHSKARRFQNVASWAIYLFVRERAAAAVLLLIYLFVRERAAAAFSYFSLTVACPMKGSSRLN